MDTRKNAHNAIDRRTFMRSTAAIGAGLFIASDGCGKEVDAKKPDPINVALVGLGEQCQRLIMQAIVKQGMDKSEAIHFKAICDISAYKRKALKGRLRYAKHDVSEYDSYEKMLAEEKDLDAAIVATPDWVHAPISIACMKA
ncbi:MAG: Gfo/Idh/MocA family oxidoreductase, partial [Planctomycetes bacterium]|nr:Gfo/Idh/MocA family oxidoreductase [Planctomycetota bacterium]